MKIFFALVLLFSAAMAQAQTHRGVLLEAEFDALRARIDVLRGPNPVAVVYSIGEDNIGYLIVSELVRAAREGRKPRLVIDALHVGRGHYLTNETLAYLQSEGVEIKLHRPLSVSGLLREGFGQINQRMHVKLITNSEDTLLTGSRNLDNSHFRLSSDVAHHDMDALFFGPAARSAREYQEVLWNGPNTEPLRPRPIPPGRQQEIREKVARVVAEFEEIGVLDGKAVDWKARSMELDDARFLFDHEILTTGRYVGSGDTLITMLREASQEFILESQYFIPDDELLRELQAAVKRGVKVKILVNGWSAHLGPEDRLTRTAYESLMGRLAAAGVEVREFQGLGKIHSKHVAIDGKKCNVWSFNIDNRSKMLNLEAGVHVTSPAFCHKLSSRIESRFQMARQAIRSGKILRPQHCPNLFDRIGAYVLWNNL